MSREDFTSPFRDGLKNSTFGGFSSLIKRRNCHGTPDFCVFHGSFLCEQGRTTRGQSPCFLPEDEQTTTMLIAEIRQSPSRCHAEELYDNGTTHLIEDAPNGARFLLGFAFSDLRFSPCTSNHVTMRKVYDDKGDNLCNRTSYIKLSQTE